MDPAIVLLSTRNDRKIFSSSVSPSLALIEKKTRVSNQKHVPTKQNPLSRGAGPDLAKSYIWITGPAKSYIWISVVRKITASRENRRELLGDEVMKTASHRNCTLQVTLSEFQQLLQGTKWESVFTPQRHFVDFSQDHSPVCSLHCNTIQQEC